MTAEATARLATATAVAAKAWAEVERLAAATVSKAGVERWWW